MGHFTRRCAVDDPVNPPAAAICGEKKDGEEVTKVVAKFQRPWNIYLEENKSSWKELSIKGKTFLKFND